MRRPIVSKIIPLGLAVAGAIALYFWLTPDAATKLAQRLPGEETSSSTAAEPTGAVKLVGQLVKFDGIPADLSGAWPRFRGPNLDAVSSENLKLAGTWPPDGPPVLWSVDLGEGYAGPAVLAGRAYVLDYDHRNQADAVRCLSLADGKEIWRYSYPVRIKRNHGMSRTVPAVTENYIVTIGPKCHVTCLDSTTGEFRWMFNLVKEFNAKVPAWYAGQCPLIDNDRAIIAVGGDTLMMAVDCNSGRIVWQSPNPKLWQMTHSSVVPVEFAGVRMYIYCASEGVVGISADDGRILWEYLDWKIRIANVPSPVIIAPDLIFLSGGYNAGSLMLRLTQEDGKIIPQTLFRIPPDVFGSPQHTPVFYDNYIYGVRPDGQLACLDLNGKIVWTSSGAHRFGLGPYIVADGLIFVMNDSGLLTMARATPAGYEQLAQVKVLQGPESWAPMAVASGRLLVRDLNRMICLDVTAR